MIQTQLGGFLAYSQQMDILELGKHTIKTISAGFLKRTKSSKSVKLLKKYLRRKQFVLSVFKILYRKNTKQKKDKIQTWLNCSVNTFFTKGVHRSVSRNIEQGAQSVEQTSAITRLMSNSILITGQDFKKVTGFDWIQSLQMIDNLFVYFNFMILL